MPDPVVNDPAIWIKYAALVKSMVIGIFGGVTAMLAFINKFQTKKGCSKAHLDHDKLMGEKEEGYKKDLRNLEDKLKSLDDKTEIKLGAIHDSTVRQEKLLEKVADAVFLPRGT